MSEETLTRIADWCEAANDLSMDGPTVTVAGDPPIEVVAEPGDDAVVLRHTHAVGDADEDFAGQAEALLGGRGSMLEGEVVTGKSGTRVEIRYPIYLDGLNRQTFLLAIRDITGTADALVGLAGSAPGAKADEPVSEPDAEPEAAAPREEAAAEAEAEVEPEAAPAASTTETVVVDAAAAWVPTHTVPGGGMSAWAEPDPGLAPIAMLSARVELQVDEQRGAWARVTGSNGWTGWVDARKLRPLGAASEERVPVTTAAPGAAAGPAGTAGGMGLTIKPLALLGGLAMIIGSLPIFHWLPPLEADSWDVGLGWLWQGSLDNPRLGLVMVVLGIAALALAVLSRAPAGALMAVAGLGLIVTALFTIHVIRLDWLAAGQIEVLWDGGIGAGWWIAFLGSAVAAIPMKIRV